MSLDEEVGVPSDDQSLKVKGQHVFTGKYTWEDAFLLKDQLTEDETLIRDAAQTYAREALLPRVVEGNRNEKFDREIVSEMGELGLLGCTLKGYGCADAGYVSY